MTPSSEGSLELSSESYSPSNEKLVASKWANREVSPSSSAAWAARSRKSSVTP